MKILLMSFLLFYSCLSNANIFKCLDSRGKVSYSDQHCTKSSSSNVIKQSSLEKRAIKIHPQLKTMRSLLSSHFYKILFATYVLMSMLCYYYYFLDKGYSQTGQRRIPENRLHTFELLGGWPGAFLAQQMLRHKNRKQSYQFVFWFIVSLHGLVWMDYLALNHLLLNSLKAYLSTRTIA
jgi:uncharacterized membrane protein YsdA (DUF1294 family)